ncbi:kynurenine formamidase [Kordia periserrulae]|uniref:Kynurenine formamidase n=1 Tax=Kordia periserrulae TaxID=701523 RepID=A0A2T6C7B2_9FLAO|nr:cyclase family protein [Kordia periserrulae]PTX64204.1 kynurenine formamidase [Kordia periserrulae]
MKKIYQLTLIASFLLIACGEKDTNTSQKAEMSEKVIIDLSHSYSEETVYWVTAKEFDLDTVFMGKTDKGFFYAANNFSTAEHGGTHIDAPIHFAEKGQSVDEIPLEKLMGAAIKIDVSANALPNPDYLITVDDLKAWEKEHSKIPDGSIVLLQTGFAKYYPNKVKYMGTDERGDVAIEKLHFPGLSPEAAEWLVQQRNINAIGIDTPSIDYGQSTYFKSHVILLEKNIPAFENLTNLDQLPNSGFEIIALPMKIKGGSGAPLRIVAILTK